MTAKEASELWEIRDAIQEIVLNKTHPLWDGGNPFHQKAVEDMALLREREFELTAKPSDPALQGISHPEAEMQQAMTERDARWKKAGFKTMEDAVKAVVESKRPPKAKADPDTADKPAGARPESPPADWRTLLNRPAGDSRALSGLG